MHVVKTLGATSVVSAAVLALALGGCAGLLRPFGAATTIEQRLASHYPDLAEGPFAVIADFEQVEQMELVRVAGPSAMAPVLAEKGGVAATGAGCVRVTLSASDDALILDDTLATHAMLKRDWRPFDLLIANVHSPRENLAIELTLTAAAPAAEPTDTNDVDPHARATSSVTSKMLLRSGWNVLRLDLTEAAERLALDDVRELRWSVPDPSGPVELRVDDVIVAANRKDLFGNSTLTTGELYVQRQGRRWNVGAGGRFELGFSQGQVVTWYDLASDPRRVRNLIGGGALGPIPVIVPGDPDEGFRSPHAGQHDRAGGESITARQRLTEMSPLRIMVESDWRFVAPGGTPSADSPYYRWQWSIYRSGQVYVQVECSPSGADEDADSESAWGVVFTTVDVPDEHLYLHPTAQLSDPDDLRQTSFAAICPNGDERCGLLIVPADGRTAPLASTIHNVRERQVHLLMSGGATQRPSQVWRLLLSLWPPGNAAADARDDRALAYANARLAGPVELAIGAPAAGRSGDRDGDGFDEGQGCYAIAPDGNRVRIYFDARQRAVDWPVFCVTDVKGRQPAVYVDQTILAGRQIASDADGNTLFQIPSTLNGRHLIEVYLRDASASP